MNCFHSGTAGAFVLEGNLQMFECEVGLKPAGCSYTDRSSRCACREVSGTPSAFIEVVFVVSYIPAVFQGIVSSASYLHRPRLSSRHERMMEPACSSRTSSEMQRSSSN